MVLRLYTGLEGSLENRAWKPEGVPTVYNFVDRASKKYDLTLMLTCKDVGKTYTSGWKLNRDIELLLEGLSAPVLVLSGINFFSFKFPRKLAMILRDLRHLYRIILFVRSERPDLIYCDGANVTFAFCLTNIFPKIPVVLRLLGICSFLRSLPDAKRFVHRIYKFAFQGRFAMAIGTQDGTGTEFFFDKVLRRSVPKCVLLNGVDEAKAMPALRQTLPERWSHFTSQCKTILFVGRIEEDKGVRIFIDAMISSLSNRTSIIRAIVVGSGSLLQEMKSKVASSGFSENFYFTGSVPHRHILGFHQLSDIYVSANFDGNLTNANLEAISANACMIVPEPQHHKNIDVKTTEYLSDAVIYFRHDDPVDLSKKLLHLINTPREIKKFSNKMRAKKQSFLRSWNDRVDEEIQILNEILL